MASAIHIEARRILFQGSLDLVVSGPQREYGDDAPMIGIRRGII
jgi:hypothetical protein